MTNHVHLLVTPGTANAISLLIQDIGRHFVPSYINKTYQRRGSLWEGRHKSHILESEVYFLTCMRYIEVNPVRAKMVDIQRSIAGRAMRQMLWRSVMPLFSHMRSIWL